MKIIRFLGGLGNQMFQYACYKALQKEHTNVKADLSSYIVDKPHNGYELASIFNLKLNTISPFKENIYNFNNRKWIYRKLRKIPFLNINLIEEQKYFMHDPSIFTSTNSGYYVGFWQNEGYFANISEDIRKDFEFKPLKNQKNIEILNKINEYQSVSVHVRRGDYVNHPSFGGICERKYYIDAIKQIKLKIHNPKFFIFSNDIDWCNKNLDFDDAEFISWNNATDSYIDMQLMSACKHNIIANSSFSWWGAWLNNNLNKIVIGPRKWINDPGYDTSTILPKDWIRL